MADIDFQQLSTVQNNLMPKPPTLASATTIAPTTFLTLVSGAAAIATVTPPVTGTHMLLLWPTGAFTMTTAGNVLLACTAVVNSPVLLLYDPNISKYRNAEVPVAT
jgi:hypothetical protein